MQNNATLIILFNIRPALKNNEKKRKIFLHEKGINTSKS
jgi:hypothetical protein